MKSNHKSYCYDNEILMEIFRECVSLDTKASEVGILGTTPGFVGVLSASQAINYLLKNPVIRNKLLYCSMGDFQIDLIDIKINTKCSVC